jgi:RNase P/RNase MRP subunit POP5
MLLAQLSQVGKELAHLARSVRVTLRSGLVNSITENSPRLFNFPRLDEELAIHEKRGDMRRLLADQFQEILGRWCGLSQAAVLHCQSIAQKGVLRFGRKHLEKLIESGHRD